MKEQLLVLAVVSCIIIIVIAFCCCAVVSFSMLLFSNEGSVAPINSKTTKEINLYETIL